MFKIDVYGTEKELRIFKKAYMESCMVEGITSVSCGAYTSCSECYEHIVTEYKRNCLCDDCLHIKVCRFSSKDKQICSYMQNIKED